MYLLYERFTGSVRLKSSPGLLLLRLERDSSFAIPFVMTPPFLNCRLKRLSEGLDSQPSFTWE